MHYRLTAANGQLLDEGDGTAQIDSGALVVSPSMGQPIRVRPTDIVEVSEPAPYVVRLKLNEGPSLDLSRRTRRARLRGGYPLRQSRT